MGSAPEWLLLVGSAVLTSQVSYVQFPGYSLENA